MSDLETLLAKAAMRPWRATSYDEGFDLIECDDNAMPLAEAVEPNNSALIIWLVNNAPEALRAAASHIEQLERGFEFIARYAATKPNLTARECLSVITNHPDIKEILERWARAALHPGGEGND